MNIWTASRRTSRFLRRLVDDDPALELRDRLRLLDGYGVADFLRLVLDMRVVVLRPPHGLLQERMGEASLDLHDQRLFLLVADDDALQNSLRHVSSVLGLGGGALLRGDGFDARNVATDDAHARGVLELSARLLETQVEPLLPQLEDLVGELVFRHHAQVGNAAGLLHHGSPYSAMRWTKRVLIGSFAAASRNASRATVSGTPSTSNMMRPGATRATQSSGAPLPLPMRTSIGFFDTGTSGNTRIQTRPARFMWRVNARRAASIWRAVTRSGSSAFRPNSPKFSTNPPFASPWIRPLKALRNLVLLGCIMILDFQ